MGVQVLDISTLYMDDWSFVAAHLEAQQYTVRRCRAGVSGGIPVHTDSSSECSVSMQ